MEDSSPQRRRPKLRETRAGAAPRRTTSARTLVLLLLFCSLCPLPAQDRPLSEYEVKARYLYSFPLFVEWPEQAFHAADAPFILGIVGRDPFGTALDGLARNGVLRGRRVIVRRLTREQDLRQCQVLFISRSEKDHLNSILSMLAGGSVLTVSEIEGFSASGGIIGLVFDDDRVRFEINLDTAADAGLTISAKLSSLARTVRRGARIPQTDPSPASSGPTTGAAHL
jgi:YfiR/HmsC-like